MTELQYTILEASNDDLITFEEASMMLTMYESGSFGDKVKKAWEAFKKWVKEIIDKITKKVAEFKEKIFGKKEAKVTVKSDPKKVKNLLRDVNSHLKPSEDFNGSFWEKIKGKAAITAIVGVAGGAVTITAVEAHKHAEEIRDLLIQLNNKLENFKCSDKLSPFNAEFNEDDNSIELTPKKGAAVINIVESIVRPIISFAQSFLISLLIITNKKDDEIRQTADVKRDASIKSDEDLKKWDIELKNIAVECDKARAEFEKISKSEITTEDELNQLREASKKHLDLCKKYDDKIKEGYGDISSDEAIDKRYEDNRKLFKESYTYFFNNFNSVMRAYIARLNVLLRKAKKCYKSKSTTALELIHRDFTNACDQANSYNDWITGLYVYKQLSKDDRAKLDNFRKNYKQAINDAWYNMQKYRFEESAEDEDD